MLPSCSIPSSGVGISTFYKLESQFCMQRIICSRKPTCTWLTDAQKLDIVDYASEHQGECYRRLAYMMIAFNCTFASASIVNRVLKKDKLLNRFINIKKRTYKGNGFQQPQEVYQHRNTDIKYAKFHYSFLFLITFKDGFSINIVFNELFT